MGQTSYVYILWLVILAAGLWIIISYGSLLHAQEDLAGDWELTPERSTDKVEALRMKVDQSGRYFNISFPSRSPLRMKMTEQVITDMRFGEHKRITLTGDGAKAIFEGRSGGDLWRFSLDQAADEAFVARLIDRTYPKHPPATQPAAASVHAR